MAGRQRYEPVYSELRGGAGIRNPTAPQATPFKLDKSKMIPQVSPPNVIARRPSSAGSSAPSVAETVASAAKKGHDKAGTGYDSDEEKRFNRKEEKANLLALDKFKTDQFLVVKQQYRMLIPDGVLVDKTAIVVTGKPIPVIMRGTHYETLLEAVEWSDDGQIIVLQEGQHFTPSNSIVLDKRIKIVGVRRPESAVDPTAPVSRIKDSDRMKFPDHTTCDLMYNSTLARVYTDYGSPAFLIVGDGVQLCGISVSQRLNYKPSQDRLDACGMGAFCAIEIAAGNSRLEEVHVSSDAGIGVKVHSGANPHFSKCCMSFSRLEGLWFGEGAKGMVQDCQIFSSSAANLHIETGADPIVFRNKIFQSLSCGVRVTAKGMGNFMENQIYACKRANVRVDDEAEPIFRKNVIREGVVEGISVLDNGLGTFEHNDIHSNASSGVVILSGGDPKLKHNSIHRNREHGVYITGEGCGNVSDNDIFQNVLACVYIDGEGSNPVLFRNKICNGLGTGVTICDQAKGLIEDNEIFLNKLAGIEVRNDGDPTVRANRIYEGLGVGVRVGVDGRGQFVENEIYRNSHAGVAVEEGADPLFQGNAIYEGDADGVVCTAYGCGTFIKNRISKNSLMGFVITREANPLLIGNLVSENKICGIQIADKGRGVLEGNKVLQNYDAGLRVESKATPLIQKDNRFFDGKAEGVLFTKDGQGVFRGNRVYNNRGAGVAVEESAPLIRKNFIYAGQGAGLHVRDKAAPRVERNDIFSNRGAGVLIDDKGNPGLKKNLIREGKSDGIVVGAQGRGVIEGNRIFMNANTGLKVLHDTRPKVLRNQISNGNGVGLHIIEGGGVFEGNEIAGNYGEQLRLDVSEDTGALTFINNTLDWKTQPSFRSKDLVKVIRAQADPAFLEEKEVPVALTSSSKRFVPDFRGAVMSTRTSRSSDEDENHESDTPGTSTAF